MVNPAACTRLLSPGCVFTPVTLCRRRNRYCFKAFCRGIQEFVREGTPPYPVVRSLAPRPPHHHTHTITKQHTRTQPAVAFSLSKASRRQERTLLVTGLLEAAMQSRAQNGAVVETPHLNFEYSPPAGGCAELRENGESWSALLPTVDYSQPW